MNALLIAVITYIRFQVGAKGGGSNEDVFASTAQDVSGYSTAAGGFSTPEVVLLAAILGAAAVFSFILAFVSTDPLDGEKKRALGLVELEAEKSLAAASSARLEEFSEASLELIGWHCDAVRWRARDQIIVALCHLASDPAIATRLTRNPPSILRSSSLREDSSRSDARELG